MRGRALLPRLLALPVLLALLVACGQDSAPPGRTPSGRYEDDGRWSGDPLPARRRPNIVLVVIDTLRADAVRPALEGGGDMPFLAGLAREHVAFTQASSTSSWTVPAFTSMLTGLLPSQHGMRTDEQVIPRPGQLLSLAEVLQRSAGYQTAAFFGGLWPPMVSALSQGFEEAHDGFHLQQAEEVLGAWAGRRRTQEPFFLLLHTFEAHDPYGEANHPPIGRPLVRDSDVHAVLQLGENPAPLELARRAILHAGQRHAIRSHPGMRAHHETLTRYLWSGLRDAPDPAFCAELEQAYRSGARWVDGLLERTFALLRARGLLENTLFIVTSDHGEAFGEHGMLLHSRQLYDELLRIPLVMGGVTPFDRPLESPASVSLVDLLPTLLDLLGLPVPPDLPGRSLVPGLREENVGLPALAEVSRTAAQTAGESVAELFSVRTGAWKYIGTLDRTLGTLTEEAYDLRSDRRELRNLATPAGLVGELPFDAAFCKAVERARDRLWASVLPSTTLAEGYGSQAPSHPRERPTTDCDKALR